MAKLTKRKMDSRVRENDIDMTLTRAVIWSSARQPKRGFRPPAKQTQFPVSGIASSDYYETCPKMDSRVRENDSELGVLRAGVWSSWRQRKRGFRPRQPLTRFCGQTNPIRRNDNYTLRLCQKSTHAPLPPLPLGEGRGEGLRIRGKQTQFAISRRWNSAFAKMTPR